MKIQNIIHNKKRKNFNIPVDADLIKKAKIKADILEINMSTYLERLIEENTKNIFLEKLK